MYGNQASNVNWASITMLIYLMLFTIFILEFLAKSIGGLPRVISWMPELLSGMAIVLLFGAVIKKYKINIGYNYVFLFVFIFLVMLVSSVSNSVQAGAVFAGMRTYVKYIPFFFLPIMLPVTENILRNNLLVVLCFALLQLPVSFYQRFVKHSGVTSGDVIIGTVGESHLLTIITLSAVSMVLAAYYKKFITQKHVLLLFVLLLIPPTINETTITIFLLPLAFIIPTFIYAKGSADKSKLIAMSIVGLVFLVIFTAGYNMLYGARWGGSIFNIFTSQAENKELSSFLMKKDASIESDARVKGEVGRFDSIMLAYKYLSEYPTKLAMGVGIGNAADSFSEKFIGDYNIQYISLGGSTTGLSHLLWEVGLIGVILVLVLFIMIYRDAYLLMQREGIYGVLALGWTAVMSFMLVSLIYKNIIPANVIGYLFWYFSGCIVAEKYRVDLAKKMSLNNEFLPQHARS